MGTSEADDNTASMGDSSRPTQPKSRSRVATDQEVGVVRSDNARVESAKVSAQRGSKSQQTTIDARQRAPQAYASNDLAHNPVPWEMVLSDKFSDTYTETFGVWTWMPLPEPEQDNSQRQRQYERYRSIVGRPIVDTLSEALRALEAVS